MPTSDTYCTFTRGVTKNVLNQETNFIIPSQTEPYHFESNLNPTEKNRIESFYFKIKPSLSRIAPPYVKICIEMSFIGGMHTPNENLIYRFNPTRI